MASSLVNQSRSSSWVRLQQMDQYHSPIEPFCSFLQFIPEGPIRGKQRCSHNWLKIETKNHVQTTYMLAEKPEVRFEGTNLRVVSAKADATYKLLDILRFTYEKRSVTGVNELRDAKAAVDYEDGELVISGIKAGGAVGIYSLDGKLVRQLTARHAGTYRLSLSALPKGGYIVKADNATYKILKR